MSDEFSGRALSFISDDSVDVHALINRIMRGEMPNSEHHNDSANGYVRFNAGERNFRMNWALVFISDDPDLIFQEFKYRYDLWCPDWILVFERMNFSDVYAVVTYQGNDERIREDMILMRMS